MSNDQSNSNDESANENLNPFFNIEDNEPGNGHITDDESAEMVNPTFSLSTDDLPAVNYRCPLIRHIHVPHSRPRRLHPPHLSHRRSYDETFRSCLIRALNLIVTMALQDLQHMWRAILNIIPGQPRTDDEPNQTNDPSGE
jgi:hypothetical protein